LALCGLLGVAAPFIILSVYSVIGGRASAYVVDTVLQGLAGLEARAVQVRFDELLAAPLTMMAYHLVYMEAHRHVAQHLLHRPSSAPVLCNRCLPTRQSTSLAIKSAQPWMRGLDHAALEADRSFRFPPAMRLAIFVRTHAAVGKPPAHCDPSSPITSRCQTPAKRLETWRHDCQHFELQLMR
jgi:hypothetical protein